MGWSRSAEWSVEGTPRSTQTTGSRTKTETRCFEASGRRGQEGDRGMSIDPTDLVTASLTEEYLVPLLETLP